MHVHSGERPLKCSMTLVKVGYYIDALSATVEHHLFSLFLFFYLKKFQTHKITEALKNTELKQN